MTHSILGIDYGRQRIGLAVAGNGVPERLQTLEGGPGALDTLESIIGETGAREVVVGLPRNGDGDDTPWTEEVRQFTQELAARVRIKIVLQDEFGTTDAARERLSSSKLSDEQVKMILDQEAAVILLEDYLRAA